MYGLIEPNDTQVSYDKHVVQSTVDYNVPYGLFTTMVNINSVHKVVQSTPDDSVPSGMSTVVQNMSTHCYNTQCRHKTMSDMSGFEMSGNFKNSFREKKINYKRYVPIDLKKN